MRWRISPHSYHQQVSDARTHTLRVILLKIGYLVFSAMRANAVTRSKAFSALIFLLSLGPVAVNIVRARRCLREFTRTHDVISHAGRLHLDLDSADMSTRCLAAWRSCSLLQSRCILGEFVVLSVVAGVSLYIFINYSCA